MFDDIQKLFRQSLDAFREERARREPEDEVAELLTAMRRELARARAGLPALRDALKEAQGALAHERTQLAQCERRGVLADEVGDAETVRVAAEFAARHRERIAVLEQKVQAVQAEQTLREREVAEMTRRYQEADANRFVLVAELRQARTREQMRARLDGSQGPFADFSRMEETIEERAGYAEAFGELDEADPPPSRTSPDDVETRLRELKRRMGAE